MVRAGFLFFLIIINSLDIAQAASSQSLSLHEAILLALRDNPNVAVAELNQVQTKFAFAVAKWQFKPHYSFNAVGTLGRTVINGITQPTNAGSIFPTVSWLSSFGTQVSFTANNNYTREGYNPNLSLQVVQPLMQGFGRPVVEAALCNAQDSVLISRLNVEGTLRATVTAVINGYLQVVSAQNTLEVEQKALHRAEISVLQTKKFIKAGRKAGSELVTVEADVANAQTRIENDKNNLDQARYALLAAIGVDPNAPIQFTTLNVPDLIKKYHLPTRDEAQMMTLKNDIQFQVDQIMLHGAMQRALLIAQDNTRPQLNLTLNSTLGGAQQGITQMWNGDNQTNSAMLTLSIPIDNQALKQSVMTAKIAIKQATLALRQEKWNKETNAINGWNSIGSAERALRFAENAERLQEKTYNLSLQKYQFGIIDSIALQSVQSQLISAQQALVNAQIAYLNALVSLDQLTGTTLTTWDIHLRQMDAVRSAIRVEDY